VGNGFFPFLLPPRGWRKIFLEGFCGGGRGLFVGLVSFNFFFHFSLFPFGGGGFFARFPTGQNSKPPLAYGSPLPSTSSPPNLTPSLLELDPSFQKAFVNFLSPQAFGRPCHELFPSQV